MRYTKIDEQSLIGGLLPNEDTGSRENVDKSSQMDGEDGSQADTVAIFLVDDDDGAFIEDSLASSAHGPVEVERTTRSLLTYPQETKEILFNGSSGIELAEDWIKYYLERNNHIAGESAGQSSRRLLQLPQELHDQIYKHLLWSTRLTFRKRYSPPGEYPKFVGNTRESEYMTRWLKPASNFTADSSHLSTDIFRDQRQVDWRGTVQLRKGRIYARQTGFAITLDNS